MQTDAQILEMVKRAFAVCRRPVHFTNFKHCDECAEHDELLRSRDVDTLKLDDVGNPGWDPICFISPEGFAYYLPALARLALASNEKTHTWYVSQMLFHLCSDGHNNQRFQFCSPEQQQAIVTLLHHLAETKAALIDEHRITDELFQAIAIWSEDSKPS